MEENSAIEVKKPVIELKKAEMRVLEAVLNCFEKTSEGEKIFGLRRRIKEYFENKKAKISGWHIAFGIKRLEEIGFLKKIDKTKAANKKRGLGFLYQFNREEYQSSKIQVAERLGGKAQLKVRREPRKIIFKPTELNGIVEKAEKKLKSKKERLNVVSDEITLLEKEEKGLSEEVKRIENALSQLRSAVEELIK